jgi:general secretion pathway protein M
LTSGAGVSRSLGRIAALCLVGMALGLAALAAFGPFAWLSALGEEIAAVGDQIKLQERLLATTGGRTAHAAQEVLLTGETSGMAGAELQRIVSELARRSGLSLRRTNVAAPKREAELTVIGVDVSLQGQLVGLRSFLHAIETGFPLLFVETLSVKTVPSLQPVAQQPVQLDVALRVRGYGAGKEGN